MNVDEIIADTLVDLSEYFGDLNDDPDAPLGEYARVSRNGNQLTVLHETEDIGFVITIEPFTTD